MKYNVSSSIPPSIIELSRGTYVVPTWMEVPKGTTLEQIVWKPEKITKIDNPNIIEVKSSSGGVYQIKKVGNAYQCNCPGFWRSKDRVCKHIKTII